MKNLIILGINIIKPTTKARILETSTAPAPISLACIAKILSSFVIISTITSTQVFNISVIITKNDTKITKINSNLLNFKIKDNIYSLLILLECQ